jgi:hypothetical protein
MGDTLTHLPDEEYVERLIATVRQSLIEGGLFVITLRDYSTSLTGEQRFIPVRSDESRIFVCFLEYTDTRVRVSDILHRRAGSQWTMSVSSYDKLRILPEWLDRRLRRGGFSVTRDVNASGMLRFVARHA